MVLDAKQTFYIEDKLFVASFQKSSAPVPPHPPPPQHKISPVDSTYICICRIETLLYGDLAVITNSDAVKQEGGISGEGHGEGEIGEEGCEGNFSLV